MDVPLTRLCSSQNPIRKSWVYQPLWVWPSASYSELIQSNSWTWHTCQCYLSDVGAHHRNHPTNATRQAGICFVGVCSDMMLFGHVHWGWFALQDMEKLAARLADSKTRDLMLGNPWPDGLRAESLTKFARGAPSKWWQCCGLRAKSQWPMWHSRFGLPSCQRAVRHCCSRGQRRTTQYPTECGVVYSVYAGAHTVLLPSVWSAVACGEDGFGQCNICHQSGHHRLVVMAGWFFEWLLCLPSPVPTVLRMISDVKGHDMKDHMVCN